MLEPYKILAVGETKDTFDGQTWTRDNWVSAFRLARRVAKMGATAEVYENGHLIRKLDPTTKNG